MNLVSPNSVQLHSLGLSNVSPEIAQEIVSYLPPKERWQLKLASQHFHHYIVCKSIIKLETASEARQFATVVLQWNCHFPHSQGFANTYYVGIEFDYQELKTSSLRKLQQAFQSLRLEEFNIIAPLGSPTSWISLIPSCIKRLRLKDCFLNEEINEKPHPDFLLLGWADSLQQFTKLESISIDYDGIFFDVDEESDADELEQKWIRSWSSVVPTVVRVYLNHTYNEELGSIVEDDGYFLGHNAFWCKDAGGGWYLYASGERVFWFDDPDIFAKSDINKYPYKEDGITFLSVTGRSKHIYEAAVRRRFSQ